MLTHTNGRAVEDYVAPDRYLEVINLFVAGEEAITTSDLFRSKTNSKSVDDWCTRKGVKPPGKRIIASYLVEHAESSVLAAGNAEDLRTLHERIVSAFER